jgi:hypothetical protein
MKNETKTFIAGIFFGAVLMLFFLISLGATPTHANRKWEKEIVQRGYGKYVVSTNKVPPVVVFEWNVNTNK